MKKNLFALALIAAASAASAQSSLTVYGVVDASVEGVKGDKTVTRVSSDNLATSRLGFKGTEDLGGGLKANFVLETAVKVDTGANGGGTSRFFDRAAWVGLAGGFGELRLGRQDTSIGVLAGNSSILGAQAYDDFKIAGTFAGDTYRRTDNAITYVLPKLVNGLSAQVQYSTAADQTQADNGETASSKRGEHYGLNVQYAAGAFGAGAGYLQAKLNAAGSQEAKAALAYVSYDFGLAKLTGYYNRDASPALAEARQLYGARVDVPVGSAFNVQASVSRVKDQLGSSTADDNATIVALKGVYSLSKRTAVYGLFTNISNDTGSKLALSGATLANGDKSSRGVALGLSHKF